MFNLLYMNLEIWIYLFSSWPGLWTSIHCNYKRYYNFSSKVLSFFFLWSFLKYNIFFWYNTMSIKRIHVQYTPEAVRSRGIIMRKDKWGNHPWFWNLISIGEKQCLWEKYILNTSTIIFVTFALFLENNLLLINTSEILKKTNSDFEAVDTT